MFERLALSRDKAGVLALAQKGHEITQPADLVKDPFVLEFAGLRQDERFRESDLEQALIAKLQQFLLELGKGFAFMGRQQRITLDGEHFFIDLVFYNRLTRSFVLLDLKVGELTHQDLGQMQMYVNYYQRELTAPDENPPIGIVLCTDKSEAVVRYTLPEGNTQIFASRYKLHLPTEEELAAELQRERQQIEFVARLGREAAGDGESIGRRDHNRAALTSLQWESSRNPSPWSQVAQPGPGAECGVRHNAGGYRRGGASAQAETVLAFLVEVELDRDSRLAKAITNSRLFSAGAAWCRRSSGRGRSEGCPS